MRAAGERENEDCQISFVKVPDHDTVDSFLKNVLQEELVQGWTVFSEKFRRRNWSTGGRNPLQFVQEESVHRWTVSSGMFRRRNWSTGGRNPLQFVQEEQLVHRRTESFAYNPSNYAHDINLYQNVVIEDNYTGPNFLQELKLTFLIMFHYLYTDALKPQSILGQAIF
ncbi:phosphatidylinositol glycan, class c [Culex quinquefasciatus]|uniref:Phosphatidylinositol glycan, class c n=1 Tax=Culex quinquefasciatus TaxID=7176 RepID=B0XHY8_CULQU|nr:phosphatidylinositol glycan, class c [Culex quinquefasciatus]|eukprot:XP_001869260.1 phosphatidylinositol glycan, class c [Culex quinquefasciatus]